MDIELILSTLREKGLLTQSKERPYEESLDKWQPYSVSWDDLPRGADFIKEDFDPRRDRDQWRRQWEGVAELISQSDENDPLASARHVDALAWYLPFHRWGADSGIYIREDAVIGVARGIKHFVHSFIDPVLEAKQLVHQALAVLFFHEMFHHRMECFATRLEIARNSAVFVPYESKVFFVAMHSDGLLEEAYACAEMLRRLGESRYCDGIHRKIRAATRLFLKDWIPNLAPGYRLGLNVYHDYRLGELQSQIAAASLTPSQPPTDWALAPDMTRSFLRVDSIMKVIIPKGVAPTIPWLDTAI